MASTITTTNEALLDEAMKTAHGIHRNAAVIERREDDIRAYDEAGLANLARQARNGLTAATAHLARHTARARTTDNPHMARALKVYGITL